MAKVFRKSAVERLSSPEQLDKALAIGSPMSWLALIGVTIMIVVAIVWSVVGTLPTMLDATGIIVNPDSTGAIFTDATGVVTRIYVKKGDEIHVGDKVVELKNSKNETVTVTAKQNGYVSEILVENDMQVFQGSELLRVMPTVGEKQVVVLYVPVNDAQKLEAGMKVMVTPGFIDSQKEGHMEAKVLVVEPYAASMTNMSYVLGSDNMLADQFMQNGAVVSVICQLTTDSSTVSGYYWSNERGKSVQINDGTLVNGKIVISESAPISKLLTNLSDKLEG